MGVVYNVLTPNAQRAEIKVQQLLNCRCFEGRKVLKMANRKEQLISNQKYENQI
jgi:hypothetical protein